MRAKRAKEKRAEIKEDEEKKARKQREGQNQRKRGIWQPTMKLKEDKN